MIELKVNLPEDVFEESKVILEELGMDVNIAVGIFLKRVIIENGLPFSTRIKSYEEPEDLFKTENIRLYRENQRQHRWSDEDRLAAIELYLSDASKPESDEKARDLGIKPGSMWMAVQNVRYLATNGREGLSQYSSRMKIVWDNYVSNRLKENEGSSDKKEIILNNVKKYKTINKEMVDEVWHCFLKSRNTNEDISDLSREIGHKTGMNSRSAFIYLNILNNLVKGRKNTRNMKLSDLEYYIKKIKDELGNDEYLNALESLKLSIPHWSQIYFGGFASGVEQILVKYSKGGLKE